MTTNPHPTHITQLEQELAQRLTQLAHAFITELHQQGHLTPHPQQPPPQPQPPHHRPHPTNPPPPPNPLPRGAITLPRTPHPTSPPPSTPTSQPSPHGPHGPHDQANPQQPPPHITATANQLHTDNAHRLELTHITPHHDHIAIHINPLTPHDWNHWLSTINAPSHTPTPHHPHPTHATGHINNIPIHLTTHHHQAAHSHTHHAP